MVITLSDFPYLLSQHTELHTLFEQTSTVSQTLPETPKIEKSTKQINSGNPLSFNLFSSLYLVLISSHRIEYSTLPCDPSLILMNLSHAPLACAVMIGMERRRY
ncbi:hypothetical protein BO85DRAFT_305875 [Aspergillus piperis CBS 112811]|uniref:Uncharacterized protein n=1 Tax=Aspergillus piperis CBS 112811 TaxID=1448313 RepID=A0A8G1R101_9EURO|nr:hypothetical protein BO85DRAFT_305875 [Aspergillus piperis CBS 112811]RAH57553.1 hypothetical protein BO85DRAFT_305875 [Aspergillus piperis CBS 112811]